MFYCGTAWYMCVIAWLQRQFGHALGSSGQTAEGGHRPAFSSNTRESLVADLRTILAPQYVTRAREFATRMTKPAESVAAAADLVENFARQRRCG